MAPPDARGNVARVTVARIRNPPLDVGQWVVNVGEEDDNTSFLTFKGEDEAAARAVAAYYLDMRLAEPEHDSPVARAMRAAMSKAVGGVTTRPRASFWTFLVGDDMPWKAFLGEITAPLAAPLAVPMASLLGKHVRKCPAVHRAR